MDLYKVMLVDDEEEIRVAIKNRINWEEIGFTVIETAENGEDALEKAEKNPPDVIMTDIHMPFMDGLTMLRKMKAIVPGVKSVIFSGYDEFEYAKEAIRLETEEYILKPIDAEELRQVFVKIKNRLDEELSSKRDVEILRQYYEQSLPVLKEQFLVGLLEGRLSPSKIERYTREYKFDLDAPSFCAAVMYIAPEDDSVKSLDKMLLSVSLKQLADENLEDSIRATSVNYLDTIVVVAKIDGVDEYKNFVTIMDRICKLSKRMLSAVTFAGIGRAYEKPENIAVSFKEAKDAVAYRIFLEENQAICITDVDQAGGVDEFGEERQISRIIHEIKVGTSSSVEEKIKETIDFLKKDFESTDQLQIFYAELLVELSRLARGHKLYAEAAALLDKNVKQVLSECKDLNELSVKMFEDCDRVKSQLDEGRVNTAKQLTDKAKLYIDEHFAQSDLSLEIICNYLNVSVTYFSALFKKETGTSFVTYLTKVRMDEATRLLDTTDEKSYVIAGMVGYEEPNYFSYVFKKQYGVSPSKYRQR